MVEYSSIDAEYKNIRQMYTEGQHRNKATKKTENKPTEMQIILSASCSSFDRDIAFSFCSSPLHDHCESHSTWFINKHLKSMQADDIPCAQGLNCRNIFEGTLKNLFKSSSLEAP